MAIFGWPIAWKYVVETTFNPMHHIMQFASWRSEAASRRSIETVFVPGTEVLEKLSRQEYRRPEIVSYVGYYRDAAIFALSNGLFARVDLRPELRQVDVIPYFEACYREGNNPLQAPLPAAEIARLRRIYEETDW